MKCLRALHLLMPESYARAKILRYSQRDPSSSKGVDASAGSVTPVLISVLDLFNNVFFEVCTMSRSSNLKSTLAEFVDFYSGWSSC